MDRIDEKAASVDLEAQIHLGHSHGMDAPEPSTLSAMKRLQDRSRFERARFGKPDISI